MTPATKICCGLKPRRIFYNTSYRDDEGDFVLECKKKCGNRISITNNYKGIGKVEEEAVIKWNELLLNKKGLR